MAMLLKGVEVTRGIFAELKERVAQLKQQGIEPCLAAVECGEEGDNGAYVRSMRKNCEKLSVCFKHIVLPQSCSEQELLQVLGELNANDAVHGILVLQPLPKQISASVLQHISPCKDVDGVTNSSRLIPLGADVKGYLPCTAEACVVMLRHFDVTLAGKRAVVVGRSAVVGQPLSLLLTAADATVTVCHSKTQNLAAICREADVLVAAAGRAKLIGADAVREGQTVLDVGIHVLEDGTLCGDVDFEAVQNTVCAITPVPGGVGGVTSALLMQHVVDAAEKAAEDSVEK